MPRQLAVTVEKNFSGGVITEATGINFPENACTEADNCIFHERGFVQRRPGFDFEENYMEKTINRTDAVVTSYLWKNVSGDGSINLLVLQVGGTLHFYLPANETGFSAGELATTVTLSTFLASGAPAGSAAFTECQFASGVGYLIVVHPHLNPFVVTYNSGPQTVSSTAITMEIRDTEGVDDTLAVDNRPNTLSDLHHYNLKNQGWFVTPNVAEVPTSAITTFEAAVGDYPSNADVWWVYKNFDDIFDPDTADETLYTRGTTQAPRGHYILNPFSQDRSTASGVPNITTVTSSYQRPSTVAFFAGRVWYAGVNYAGYESKIYFSQVIDTNSEFGKCYQAADPTNEHVSDIVATDGGYLMIPGAGLIYKIMPIGPALAVFGANGIWLISGSSQIGFTAIDYSVPFVSSTRTFSNTSFVEVEGYPAWWNLEGIQMLLPAEGSVKVQSLSDTKIKELYLDIPLLSKRYARGSYDPRSHVIQWLYRSTDHSDLTTAYEFDKVLNFNTLSNAFYEWTLPDHDVSINGIFLTEGFGSNPSTNTVVIGADTVIAGGASNPVVVTSFGALVLDYANKFVVSYASGGSYKFTFADHANDDFVDWLAYDDVGTDYDSTFTTGYKFHTEGQRKFQANYIYIFSDLSEIAHTDFYFQGIWNFANDPDSGKFTSQQRITHSAGSLFDVKRNRLKVRGSGYAVQFKFNSISGEPFHIIGWSVLESSNQRD